MANIFKKIEKVSKAAETASDKASGLGRKAAEAKLKKEQTARDRAIIEAAEASKRGFLNPSKEQGRWYHGSPKEIEEFKLLDRDFVSLTQDPEFASDYAINKQIDKTQRRAPNVLPVRIQVQNPFDYENPEHIEAVLGLYKKPERIDIQNVRDNLELGNWNFIEDDNIQRAIKDAGFDSFYMKEYGAKNLGVFDPKRIKSDIGMQGDYDITSPDITRAKGGAVDRKLMAWAKEQKKAAGGIAKKAAKAAGKAAEKSAKKSQYQRILPAVKERGGEFGARRLERAFDELSNIDQQFGDEALIYSLTPGDNATSLMIMRPGDFEKFAEPLNISGKEVTKGYKPLDDYLNELGGIARGVGFEDVPFLQIGELEGSKKLGIMGHEGRHRMRALDRLGDEATLVRTLPRASVREPLPRRSREEYLRALEEKYGNPLLVNPEGIETDIIDVRRALPEQFAEGGSVTPDVMGGGTGIPLKSGGKVDKGLKDWYAAQGGMADPSQAQQAQQSQRSQDIQAYKEGKLGADALVKHFPGLTATMVEAQLTPVEMRAGGEVRMQAGGGEEEIRRQLAAGVPFQMAPGQVGDIARRIDEEEIAERRRKERERTQRVSELPFGEKLLGGYETARTLQSIVGQELFKPIAGFIGGEGKIEELEKGTPLPESEAGIEYLTKTGEFLAPIGKAIEASKLPDVPFLPELVPVSYVPGVGRQIGEATRKAAQKIDQAIPEAVKSLPVGMSTEPVGKSVTEVLETAAPAKAEPAKAPANQYGFYSQAEKAALNLQRKQGPGDAFLNELKKAGVSQDELEYTKLNDFLKGKKNVTKQEVQDFIDSNKYHMNEIEYREGKFDEDAFSFGDGEVIDDDQWISEQSDYIFDDFDSYYPGRREQIRDDVMSKYEPEDLDDPTIRERIEDEVDELIREITDEDATVQYYENPYRTYTNEAGYEINGNGDVGFTILDPNGRRVGEAYDFETAEGRARRHAEDNGLIDEGETKYHAYQLPMGENYRELLVQMQSRANPKLTKAEQQRLDDLTAKFRKSIGPDKERPVFTPEDRAELDELKSRAALATERNEYNNNPHWDDPDVIVHMRVQDRETTDGKTMLYVDEMQSDWHQLGGEYGYRSPKTKESYDNVNAEYYEAKSQAERAQQELRDYKEARTIEINNQVQESGGTNFVSISQASQFLRDDPKFNELTDKFESLQNIVREKAAEVREIEEAVPDAPFKDNWHSLGVKRILNYAAQNGYDRVGFSSSSPQIKRWGTEVIAWEKVPKIEFNKENFIKWVRENSGNAISERSLDEAWNFLDNKNNFHPMKQDFKNITERPEGWEIAATEQRGGMAGRIDLEADARARGILQEKSGVTVTSKEDVKKIVKDISRKWSKAKINRMTEKIWKQMQQKDVGMVAPREEGMKFFYDNKLKNFLQDYAKKMGGEFYEAETSSGYRDKEPVYMIEFTPKLKDSVLKGQSYKKGGLVEVDPKLRSWARKNKRMARGGIAKVTRAVEKAGAKASKRMSRAEAEAAGLWHPISETKLAKPMGEYKATIVEDPGAKMTPKKSISIEELQGGVAIPLAGDRAAAGRIIKEIEGTPMDVTLEGGPDFMRLHPGAAWASGKGVLSMLADRIKKARESGNPVYGVYTAMSPLAVDFNTMMTESLLNQLDISGLRKKDIKEFDQAVRQVKGQGNKPKAPNFPGLDDPELREKLLSGPGGQRDAFVKTMAKAGFQKKGFPDVAAARLAVTEPELLDAPRGSAGYTIAQLDPEAKIVEQSGHSTYPLDILGEYSGGLEKQLPVDVMYPSHFEAKRLLGSKPEGAHKSLELFAPLQYLDQEWLDNAMKYLEMQKKLTGRKKGGLAQAQA